MGSGTMLQNTWMHACVIQSRVTAALGRAQPRISVLSSSDSMRFVTHATVQSCAAGARMTAADAPGADTSEKRIRHACTKKCGRTYRRERVRDVHSDDCNGPKKCPYCNVPIPEPYRGDNIVGCVVLKCVQTSTALPKKRNQLHEEASGGARGVARI